MKKLIVISFVMFLLLSSGNLFSQSKNNFAKKSTWEVGGSLSFSNFKYVNNGNESDGITFVDILPYCGYFITDGFELGVIPAIEIQDYSGYDKTDLTIFLAPAYNFKTNSPAYPYVQGAIGFANESGKGLTSRSGLAWHLETGVKLNFFNNSLLKFGLNYSQKTLETSNSSGKRNGINTIGFNAGFNVFFR